MKKKITYWFIAGSLFFIALNVFVFIYFAPHPYRYALMSGITIVHLAFILLLRELRYECK